jgi:hypothetical protein
LRYIYAALRPEKDQKDHGDHGHDGEKPKDKKEELKVILISFLRPFELWKEMAKKIVRQPYISLYITTSFPSDRPTFPFPPYKTRPLSSSS